ncbi:cupin [Spiractinospora alimapuensis]|uniref:cupin domain-containing protein n=1 Tax=Spiractinospora alimapuensis TaxID=2820884 RepID=UPI001F435B6C|nr:cupin domain-containing protein [Spiractinospora alimapuensis]QVQ52490.1 cupin [Spiractinospora alimapuensis]
MSRPLFTEIVRGGLEEDFLAERLSRDVALVDVGADAVDGILTWEALGEIMSTRPLSPPRLRLHRDGAPVAPERFTELGDSSGAATRVLRPDALYRELRDGASLVLDAVDRLHPPVRDAADDLMRWVRERVQVNLYVIWGASSGFDTHWDDHDTFIVQLAGTKAWAVHGQGTRPHPLKRDTVARHDPPPSTVWEGVLRPGHVLHVPRGWWHTVSGTGEGSMHLTFGFAPPTGVDWARHIVEALHDREVARRDLPRFASEKEREEHHEALVRELVDLAGRWDVDALLKHRDDRFPRRARFSLPWGVRDTDPTPETEVEFVPILPPSLSEEEDDGATKVVCTVSGRRYRLPGVARPVLDVLVEGRRASLEDLARRSGTSFADTVRVVRALVREHLAVMRTDETSRGGR